MNRIKPTFLLRGVNPEETLKKVQQGYTIKPKAIKDEVKISTKVSREVITFSSDQGVYFLTCRAGKKLASCSGYHDCKNYPQEGYLVKGLCEHCGDAAVMGYPVAYKKCQLLIDGIVSHAYYFWMEGRACSFQCALSIVQRRVNELPYDAQTYLHLLYRLHHPNGPTLKPAYDPLLHEKNGGGLTDEAWHEQRTNLVRTSNIILIPARTEYREI